MATLLFDSRVQGMSNYRTPISPSMKLILRSTRSSAAIGTSCSTKTATLA